MSVDIEVYRFTGVPAIYYHLMTMHGRYNAKMFHLLTFQDLVGMNESSGPF
jgi:hypothetical protein